MSKAAQVNTADNSLTGLFDWSFERLISDVLKFMLILMACKLEVWICVHAYWRENDILCVSLGNFYLIIKLNIVILAKFIFLQGLCFNFFITNQNGYLWVPILILVSSLIKCPRRRSIDHVGVVVCCARKSLLELQRVQRSRYIVAHPSVHDVTWQRVSRKSS